MRKYKWGIATLLAAAGVQAAQANIVLEDFKISPTGITVSVDNHAVAQAVDAGTSRPDVAANYSAYRINGYAGTSGAITSNGVLDIAGQQGTNMEIGLGAGPSAINPGSLDFSANYAMNVDGSAYNAVVLHLANASGSTRLGTAILRSDSYATSLSYLQQPTITAAGDIILKFDDFGGLNKNAVLADIDHIQLDFSMSASGGGEIGIDSIELINAVPEPASMTLMAVAGAGLLLRRRNR